MNSEVLLYAVVVSFTWLVFFRLRNVRPRQVLIVCASCILYGSWGFGFLGLLILSSLMNYVLAVWLRRHPSTTNLWVGISLNVALLSMFKYLPGIAPLLSRGFVDGVIARIVLPVGISFWTFQALSYLLDVYRGEDLEPSLLEFLLYMTFWPTALSGPICRLSTLLPQLRNCMNPSARDVRIGLDRVCMGLTMTALGQVLARGIHLGQGLDDAFDKIPGGWGGSDVWCMAIGYGFELFFNFAGYSHIVIGASRLFGIRLDENFDRPYISTTPSEFWTRWHMSLSFWIRDYLFLPLALLRREKWWRNVALVMSMVFVSAGFSFGQFLFLRHSHFCVRRQLRAAIQAMRCPPAYTSQSLLASSATSQQSVQLNCVGDLLACLRRPWSFVLRSMRWPSTSAFCTHGNPNRLSTFSFDEAHCSHRAFPLRFVNLCICSGTECQG